MEAHQAYGAMKAGTGAIDPGAFVRKPIVVLRLAALVFGMIVSGCISRQGWQEEEGEGKVCIVHRNSDISHCTYQACIINKSSSCHLMNTLSVLAVLAAIGFVIGELCFEEMSSAKSRRRFVLADYVTSAVFSLCLLLLFLTSTFQWLQSPQASSGSGVVVALLGLLLSTFAWAGCALLARQRHQAGCDAFTQDHELSTGDWEEQSRAEPPFQQTGGEDSYQQVPY